MLFFINLKNIFISISLNISDIEPEEDSDTDESKNFNVDIQTHLAFKEKHEEFIVIKVNFNTIKKDDEEYPYNEDDLYFESNNIEHYNIIWINCIYNYCVLYLEFKVINNFFFKAIFRFMRKAYIEKEMRYWIFTIKTTIYRIFISSFKHLLIYIKDKIILEGC